MSSISPPPTPLTVSERTTYNLRNAGDVNDIRRRTELFSKSFFPSSVQLWNDLPLHIKNINTLENFKKTIKEPMYSAPIIPNYYIQGHRRLSMHHARLRSQCSNLNIDEPRHEKMCLRESPTSQDTNRPAQPQKLARVLKFRPYNPELLYYISSEQQRRWSDCAESQADLRLCCSHMTWHIFSWPGSDLFNNHLKLSSACDCGSDVEDADQKISLNVAYLLVSV